jgi:hypothetical protein
MRFTQDIDVVVAADMDADVIDELCRRLSAVFVVHRESVCEAIRRKDMFQALDTDNSVKIDFHVGEGVPGELSRSRRVLLAAGLEVPCVSREDSILSKLIWVRKGSSLSRRDIVFILRNPEPIDWTALRERAERLGVTDLLEELLARARKPPKADDIF